MQIPEFISNYEITIIKIISIMYVSILFGFCGIFITQNADKYILNKIFPRDKEHNVSELVFQISIIVGILATLSYIGINLIRMIPFPLDGLSGFDYSKEISNGTILTIFIFTYSAILAHKTAALKIKLDV